MRRQFGVYDALYAHCQAKLARKSKAVSANFHPGVDINAHP